MIHLVFLINIISLFCDKENGSSIKGNELIKEQSKYKGFIITDHDYRNILDIATRIVLIHDRGTKEIKNKDD